jgi:RNA polymerase sigma-70 factor (ECF subfamily)
MKELSNIISKSIKEDRVSQQQLYEYCYSKLSTAVALYTKDHSEKDWIFNIGMLKVFKNLEKYQANTNFLGWARTILTRSAIDIYRQQKKHNEVLVPLQIEENKHQLTEINSALNALETEDIIKLIQRLSNDERLVFTMFEIDGFSHTEIEKETGIKKNTSKWLLSKARKSLKEMIINSPSLNHYLYGK